MVQEMGSVSKRSKKQKLSEEEGEKLEEGAGFLDSEEEGAAFHDSEDDSKDVDSAEGYVFGQDDEDEEDVVEDEEGGEDSDGGCGGGELEQLENEYLSMRKEQQNLMKSLKRHKDDDIMKGQSVKNQKALWDRSLEFRFLLQKPFSNSNKLPQDNLRSSFYNDKEVEQAYSDLIFSAKHTLSSLLELQEALIEDNPDIISITHDISSNAEANDDAEWLQIHKMQHRISPFRNSSIDKWHRKTQVTTGAAAFKGKLRAFNQNISEQVATYMRDPNRMIKRMLLSRSSVGILGEVPAETGIRKEEDANVDGDPELIDDSEFYQQLLKEFFESCDPASAETAFYAMKKLQTKKRKVVDRRASKSRKIRYNVHDKIVNFMAPKPMHLPHMTSQLFQNLFGQKNQKTAPVM